MNHKNFEAATSILKELVSFDILGGQSNLSIINYIISILENNKIEYHLVPNTEGDKTSIHCRIGPAVDGGLVLSGHTDVVPVLGQNWLTDPFKLTASNDHLYGRGTCDMKGFLACCLASISLFKQASLNRPVYFAFSYDEEIGCLAGPALARAIVQKYQEKPEFAIIGEPSMMQPIIGHKGICVLETTVLGSAGHSSRIKQEVSSIHEATKLILWLEAKMDTLISERKLDPRFDPPHTTLHVGTISGGIAPNVIADKCTFCWDVRVIPEDNLEDILEEFNTYCTSFVSALKEKFSGAAIITKMNHPPVPSLGTPETSEIVHLIKEITGRNDLSTVAYAAEAGQFSNEGFKTIICGPGDIAQAHRANEFIAAEQLNQCLRMLENLAVIFSK